MRDGRVARVLFCSLSSLMASCLIAQRAMQQQSRDESDTCDASAGAETFMDLHTPFYSVYGLCQPNRTVPYFTNFCWFFVLSSFVLQLIPKSNASQAEVPSGRVLHV